MEKNCKITITAKNLETYFKPFRVNTIGNEVDFESCYGRQSLLYADWIASGRLYRPIEDKICQEIGPMLANTHSFSSETGKYTTYAYQEARRIIKRHVNADENDILVTTGTGMTGALSKLQRIMGLKKSSSFRKAIAEEDRPVVFITHMEHHSNHVPWMETIADVVILPPGENLLPDPAALEGELEIYKDRPLKIGSFTACSNVTGIITPYWEMAEILHRHDGFCFVDFAASAPYLSIDMHPKNEAEQLDAIFFSPHKFLGGPGSCGILVFHKKLYKSESPDNPGGGNVRWTNPKGEYAYDEDLEVREDGGTPGILQTMRAALAIRLKEKMGTKNIELREQELLKQFYHELDVQPKIHILGDRQAKRIGCVSFNVEGLHYNLVVRLLNDRFGIQVRGGWSCASTYGHHLFNIDDASSQGIIAGIDQKNLSDKPGWVRVSLHPTTTNAEVKEITNALKEIINNEKTWGRDYTYNPASNEFERTGDADLKQRVQDIFDNKG